MQNRISRGWALTPTWKSIEKIWKSRTAFVVMKSIIIKRGLENVYYRRYFLKLNCPETTTRFLRISAKYMELLLQNLGSSRLFQLYLISVSTLVHLDPQMLEYSGALTESEKRSFKLMQ